MNATDQDIDRLLEALDHTSHCEPYPPHGLKIWGEHNARETLRHIVRKWLASVTPEGLR